MSPALTGGFFTTEPPRKPLRRVLGEKIEKMLNSGPRGGIGTHQESLEHIRECV